MIATTRRGTGSREAMSVTASASVGATTAPRVNAAAQENPGMNSCATAATPHVVAITRPSARNEIARTFVRRSFSEVKKAAE